MRETLQAQKSEIGTGKAGLASHFVDLADKMLKRNGIMAFVLPLTAIAGDSWHKTRKFWAAAYHNVFVLTIADAATANCTFSADTGMAECLLVATKGSRVKSTGRAIFVCLTRHPDGELEAVEIVKALHKIKDIQRLEDGISRGEPICIGVDSLPNIVFKEKNAYDYVWTLWGNSTLGLLCYWLICGKQQTGRGRSSKAALDLMPTLDVRELSDEALANAERIFNELKHKQMLPFNQMDEDPVRHELDRLLLSDVLGITESERPDVHEGLALLRKMLCREPSIHGGKKSKVKLEA